MIKKIDSYFNNEKTASVSNFGITNIEKLAAILGNPHHSFKSFHIAGTNGKGSVAYMIQSILKGYGFRTGLYTSPHLERITERITVDSTEIDEDELDEITGIVIDCAESSNIIPTYFDILTLSAFIYFKRKKVNYSVIETGLGGRLDSTNIVTPVVSIITDISLDHTHILGKSVESITEEKAGIIKKSVPVVTTNGDEKILSLLKEISLKKNSDIFAFGKEFSADLQNDSGFHLNYNYALKYNNKKITINDITIHAAGNFQIKNSAAAITASLLELSKSSEINKNLIPGYLEKLFIPGRFETLLSSPLIVFDPAHNPQAIGSLINTLEFNFHLKKKVFIVSLMQDKDFVSIISAIKKYTSEIIYYELKDERAWIPDETSIQDFELTISANENNLYETLFKYRNKDTIIVFTGSFRLYKVAKTVSLLIEKAE